MGTQRGRLLKTSEWVAVDSPAETGDHTVVMAEEYVALCFFSNCHLQPGYGSAEMEYERVDPIG